MRCSSSSCLTILWFVGLFCSSLTTPLAAAQELPSPEEIPLWGVAPGSHNVAGVEIRKEGLDPNVPDAWVTGVTQPTLTVYQPLAKHRNGTAVVICPGGGYIGLAIDKEGHEIARWFRDRGVVAAVLKYRTAPMASFSLKDAQRALRIVRSRAEDWHVERNRIGIMGFSAGGHLASTAGTHDDQGDPAAKDPIDRESCHADFLVLAYPVISMRGELTLASSHSRESLLGESPSPEQIKQFSNERHVSKDTGPTFLVHTSEDKVVPVENSWEFYSALRKHNVLAELHIFERGAHGFGMRSQDLPVDSWPGLLEAWMKNRGLLR